MRARIVPRFETRRAIYSALIRGYIYLKRARFVETKPIGRIFFSPPPISFRLVFSSHFEFLSSPQWYNGSEIHCFCRRFGNVVSRIHGIIKSHDSKASLAHGSYLVYLARCHGQIIQSRCTWRLLMLVKPVAGLTRLRSIRTREWSNRFAFCSFFSFFTRRIFERLHYILRISFSLIVRRDRTNWSSPFFPGIENIFGRNKLLSLHCAVRSRRKVLK